MFPDSGAQPRIATVPDHWRRYKVKRGIAVSQWIHNLAQRLAQLEDITKIQSYDNIQVWLGGLFFPEAYVTATRQAVAHHNSWSLETLALRLDVEQEASKGAFAVQGQFDFNLITDWSKAVDFRAIAGRRFLGQRRTCHQCWRDDETPINPSPLGTSRSIRQLSEVPPQFASLPERGPQRRAVYG